MEQSTGGVRMVIILLLVVFTLVYATFSRSLACKKPLLSTGQKRFFTMISVPYRTGDIFSIRYRTSCDDICFRRMKERILHHICRANISCGIGRISYRVSNIPREFKEQVERIWWTDAGKSHICLQDKCGFFRTKCALRHHKRTFGAVQLS